MTATSTAIALGDQLPAFSGLLGADGERYSLGSFADKTLLVLVFVANGCPTVRLYEDRLRELQDRNRDLHIVLVNSNNPYLSPLDTYERVVERAQHSSLSFPYLKDSGATLARTCGAICTPHAFVFDVARRLRYRGRIDDSRTGRRVTSEDLAVAVADLLSRRHVRVPETAPFGCAIVW